MIPTLDAHALRELAAHADLHASADCGCQKTPLDGWQSQPLSLDEATLTRVGTLRADDGVDPSDREWLPDGVSYWSPDAPIAPRYFPYNRCDVWECRDCGRLLLRYTEGGGYFFDPRIRTVRANLVVDAAL